MKPSQERAVDHPCYGPPLPVCKPNADAHQALPAHPCQELHRAINWVDEGGDFRVAAVMIIGLRCVWCQALLCEGFHTRSCRLHNQSQMH